MWIKSLDDDAWVSMKHITHFAIKEVLEPGLFDEIMDEYVHYAYAYLDATMSSFDIKTMGNTQLDQTCILVCRGSKEECEQFIREQQLLESVFQWLGYFVAGGIGAVLTYFLTGSG